ncbi:MAG: hypothetical protein LBL21_02285 [Rickettsiales bacterium]|jgi:hypothetical protein|nr:hypothetical protein [Rickettsiales bacterium]
MENNIPEKFRNDDGTLNAESLLKSYSELEKKIGTMVGVPADESDAEANAKFRRAIGAPESPDDYPACPMFADAAEIKEKFLAIGLTKKQAESIYAMAEEFLAPVLEQIMAAASESECAAELRQLFGDDEKMRAALAEISDFAEKNLTEAAREALCSSAGGIKAIYGMMRPAEPEIAANGRKSDKLGERELRQMMRDPKYWRDRDDEFVRKIETGFKKLYQ